MRATYFVMAAMSVATMACNNDGARGQLDPSQLANSSGEVALSDGGTMAFTITSERYKQWDAAQRALDTRVAKRFGQLLQPASPSERSISSAVAYLEQEPRARQAIEKAGLNVRGFVELTVALEQQMRLAGGGGTRRSAQPTTTYTAPPDSGYLPVPPPSTATPMETRPIPQARTDTLFPTPVSPPTPPAPRADPVPSRDSTAPPRDTSLKRDAAPARSDSAVAPKPPPSDTLPPLPPLPHIGPAS